MDSILGCNEEHVMASIPYLDGTWSSELHYCSGIHAVIGLTTDEHRHFRAAGGDECWVGSCLCKLALCPSEEDFLEYGSADFLEDSSSDAESLEVDEVHTSLCSCHFAVSLCSLDHCSC
jgi:hypothetical protein